MVAESGAAQPLESHADGGAVSGAAVRQRGLYLTSSILRYLYARARVALTLYGRIRYFYLLCAETRHRSPQCAHWAPFPTLDTTATRGTDARRNEHDKKRRSTCVNTQTLSPSLGRDMCSHAPGA
jgi:hypothetical protein